ncbi:TetR/AcrR family transcriptional regulator (plasmid) [Coraliomargarita sp. W4R53]
MTQDPRQTRTRAALRSTLHALLADHSLDDISVALLCREAGVHRTTFYAHAQSVRHFAIAEFSGDIGRLSTVSVEPSVESPEQIAQRYLVSLRAVLEHVVAERWIYRVLLTSDSRGAFHAALDDRLRPRAALAIAVFGAQGVEGAPSEAHDCDEAAGFVAGALVGVIRVWALSDETDTAAASERVFRLMPAWWPSRS